MADEPDVTELKKISNKLDIGQKTAEKTADTAEKTAERGLASYNQAKKYAQSLEKKGKWQKKSAEQQNDLAARQYEAYKESGALNFEQYKEWQADAKAQKIERKNKQDADTRDAYELRKQLQAQGVTNEDFLASQEDLRKQGLSVDVDGAETGQSQFELAQAGAKRDAQIEADKKKKEEAKAARSEEMLQTLRGQLEGMGMDRKLAERTAKKAMQMKAAVGDWFKEKKEGFKKMAGSLLQWLLKGAGLFLLWKFFDYLSKTDLKGLYDTMVTALDFLWTGAKTFGAWVGGIKVFKWIDDFFGKSKGWKAFKDFWKGIGGKITKAFKDFKISGLITKVVNLFKAGGGIFKMIFKAFGGGLALKTWEGIIASIKSVFKMITGPFGKEGGIGKAFGKITKFLTMIPGMKTVTKFAAGVLKFIGKLFAPVMLVWGIVEAIMGGWDEAEKEKGGLGAKILAFMSGAFKALLDFFVFDLANMVQDGIKWAIKWVMSLFGFSEEEQKAATDWDLVGAVRDALFKAIDWIKNLFKFDGKGISFKGLAPLIDIILFPLDAAFKWLSSLFGWDTDKDGKKKKDWSIGGLLTSALDNIFKWLGGIFDIDFSGIVKSMLGGLGKAGSWLAGKLGLGPDTKESLLEEIEELEESSANAKGVTKGAVRRENTKKIKALREKLENLGTGGTILPGGAAIVGEGSMGGELVLNANSAAKVIPAKQTADIMSGMGGGGGMVNAPTIINSAPSSTTVAMNTSSINPMSQKYFKN